MLCDWRQSDHGLFPCDDRCKARLLHVKIFGSFDNKLGDAEDSQRRRNRDTIRLYNHDWRPRLRTLLCCYLLRTISSTTTLEATQLGSVWSLITRNVKCWKSEWSQLECRKQWSWGGGQIHTNVTKDGGGTVGIRKRITMAGSSLRNLDNIWKVTNISRTVGQSLSFKKRSPLRIVIWLWDMETHEYICWRSIFKVRWQHRISNVTILCWKWEKHLTSVERSGEWDGIGSVTY